jgi:glycosyltransferase involved in cell wall biosynthesis
MSISIHIIFELKEGPWGGGNQFLKALRDYFISVGIYSERPENASVFIFNSHHHLKEVVELKRRFPGKAFLHRCDGPILVVRGSGWEIDRDIFRHNHRIADGTIFQSEWSHKQARLVGMPVNRFEAVIHNAPASRVFHPPASRSPSPDGRIRIIAMSWSTNPMKGFDVYQFLDEHLDLKRFALTYIGNAPKPFKNIRHIPAIDSKGVAEELHNHDLFVSASQIEACSNAIGEAMNCGLPAIVRDNSSQPELVKDRRLVFRGTDDVLNVLDRVSEQLDSFRSNLKPETMEEIGKRYATFASDVAVALSAPGDPGPKRLGAADVFGMRLARFVDRIRLKAGLYSAAPNKNH